jgi:hypothetical protein
LRPSGFCQGLGRPRRACPTRPLQVPGGRLRSQIVGDGGGAARMLWGCVSAVVCPLSRGVGEREGEGAGRASFLILRPRQAVAHRARAAAGDAGAGGGVAPAPPAEGRPEAPHHGAHPGGRPAAGRHAAGVAGPEGARARARGAPRARPTKRNAVRPPPAASGEKRRRKCRTCTGGDGGCTRPRTCGEAGASGGSARTVRAEGAAPPMLYTTPGPRACATGRRPRRVPRVSGALRLRGAFQGAACPRLGAPHSADSGVFWGAPAWGWRRGCG